MNSEIFCSKFEQLRQVYEDIKALKADIASNPLKDEEVKTAVAEALKVAVDISADIALKMTALYPEWQADTRYITGDRIQYGNVLYSCLQTHTSQDTWTPDTVPSLWAKVLVVAPDVISEWEQPDSTNPYMIGDKVTHNDTVWQSTVDNNVWEPGVYGWEEIV